MRRSGKGSGGGLGMNKNREVGMRTHSSVGRAKGPGGVNQIGAHWGDHVTEGRRSSEYRGDKLDIGGGYNSGVALGNTLATNVGKGGPGKGYKQYGQSGSQGCHGPVNPGNPQTVPGKGDKDSLIDSFGPSYRGSGRG